MASISQLSVLISCLLSFLIASSVVRVCASDLRFSDSSASACFTRPYTTDCKNLVRACRGALNESALDTLYELVQDLATSGEICSQESECPSDMFALGIGCLAAGEIPTEDGDCASCEACEEQKSKKFCDVFCPGDRGCVVKTKPSFWPLYGHWIFTPVEVICVLIIAAFVMGIPAYVILNRRFRYGMHCNTRKLIDYYACRGVAWVRWLGGTSIGCQACHNQSKLIIT